MFHVIAVMAQVVLVSKPVAHVMVRVLCVCHKVSFPLSRPVRHVMVVAILLKTHVALVMDKGVSKMSNHFLSKFQRALIPVIESDYQARVKPVKMAHQRVIYMSRYMSKNIPKPSPNSASENAVHRKAGTADMNTMASR